MPTTKNVIESQGGKLPRDFFLPAALCIAALIGAPANLAAAETKKPKPRPTPYVIPGLIALGPSDPIKEEFLGLRAGMSMGEVRERLRELGAIDVAEEMIAEGKVKIATEKLPGREYDKGGIQKRGWKLPETVPFEWITVRSNRRGIVTLMTAAYRPEKAKSFEEIADLKKAVAKSDKGATWNVLRPTGNFLVVAEGEEGKAATVSLKLAEISPIFVPAKKAAPPARTIRRSSTSRRTRIPVCSSLPRRIIQSTSSR